MTSDKNGPDALSALAARLRRNAAGMAHGEAEADVRAAADILDSFADVGELEYVANPYNHIARFGKGGLVSPRDIVRAFAGAYLRAAAISSSAGWREPRRTETENGLLLYERPSGGVSSSAGKGGADTIAKKGAADVS